MLHELSPVKLPLVKSDKGSHSQGGTHNHRIKDARDVLHDVAIMIEYGGSDVEEFLELIYSYYSNAIQEVTYVSKSGLIGDIESTTYLNDIKVDIWGLDNILSKHIAERWFARDKATHKWGSAGQWSSWIMYANSLSPQATREQVEDIATLWCYYCVAMENVNGSPEVLKLAQSDIGYINVRDRMGATMTDLTKYERAVNIMVHNGTRTHKAFGRSGAVDLIGIPTNCNQALVRRAIDVGVHFVSMECVWIGTHARVVTADAQRGILWSLWQDIQSIGKEVVSDEWEGISVAFCAVRGLPLDIGINTYTRNVSALTSRLLVDKLARVEGIATYSININCASFLVSRYRLMGSWYALSSSKNPGDRRAAREVIDPSDMWTADTPCLCSWKDYNCLFDTMCLHTDSGINQLRKSYGDEIIWWAARLATFDVGVEEACWRVKRIKALICGHTASTEGVAHNNVSNLGGLQRQSEFEVLVRRILAVKLTFDWHVIAFCTIGRNEDDFDSVMCDITTCLRISDCFILDNQLGNYQDFDVLYTFYRAVQGDFENEVLHLTQQVARYTGTKFEWHSPGIASASIICALQSPRRGLRREIVDEQVPVPGEANI
ncbi:hypothetical protein K7432_014880 [Basidiobolus ranarum]|uniref:Uncharacterized protein n=1 Tax=Basidiobolus ranarum TaxID=34480 RepID=A0ABR2WGU7_9FUNG